MNIDDIELEVACDVCAADGGYIHCGKCKGFGKMLTPFGEKVMALVTSRVTADRIGGLYEVRRNDD